MNLEDRKKAIDEKLKDFLSNQKYEREDIAKVFKKIPNFILRGGKRCRPALFVEGYKIGGGNEIDECLRASILIELWHNSFLIYDDIMDRDNIRRGEKTLHKLFEDYFGQWTALSHAINAGEYTNTLSIRALTESDFPPEKKYEVMEELSKAQTIVQQGQALDLILQKKPLSEVKVSDVLDMYRLKSASYTVKAPLKSGYVLSPKSKGDIKKMEEYGENIGIAFQLKDDLLGVFGEKNEIGKPITSDLEEGKRTMPLILAYKKGSEKQKETIRSIVGGEVTKKDHKKIREIITETGAKKESEEMAKKRVKKGKKVNEDIKSDFLDSFAEFVIKRSY